MSSINFKIDRVEGMQEQTDKINTKRKQVSEQVNKQKLDIMGRFNNILKKNRGIAPDDIKTLFPDDKALYEKIISIREKSFERSNLSKISYQPSTILSPEKTARKGRKSNLVSNISIDIQTNEKRNPFFVSSPVNNKTSFSPINVKDTLLSTDRLTELEDYKNKLG